MLNSIFKRTAKAVIETASTEAAIKAAIAKKTKLHNGWQSNGGAVAGKADFGLPTANTGYTFATKEQSAFFANSKAYDFSEITTRF